MAGNRLIRLARARIFKPVNPACLSCHVRLSRKTQLGIFFLDRKKVKSFWTVDTFLLFKGFFFFFGFSQKMMADKNFFPRERLQSLGPVL
jgi:hypothetical protein